MGSPLSRTRSFPQTGLGVFATAGQEKSPRTEILAAGKCLTNMDLPLAAGEPSPPDRSSHGLRLARDLLGTQTFDQLWVPPQHRPTRVRFEFAARTHRERIHSVVFAPANFGASRELISCTQRNVKKRMALGVIFFRGTTSAAEKACGWAVHPFGGTHPCRAPGSSSKRSRVLKSRAPWRRDR